jgi:hypothetical protein
VRRRHVKLTLTYANVHRNSKPIANCHSDSLSVSYGYGFAFSDIGSKRIELGEVLG